MFTTHFNTYCSQLESPQIYIDTAALMSISAVLDGKVWISEGGFYYSPQIYSLLIGKAGLGKSTALDFAVKMHQNDLDRQAFILDGDYTHRALMDELNDMSGNRGKSTSAWVCPDEAESFFGTYTGEEMVGFLTQCFNVKKNIKYKTAHSGKVDILQPYLVFCGNVTPSFMSGNLKSDLLFKGFIRRCLFVYADKVRKRVAWPTITPEMTDAYATCVKWLKTIRELRGEFRFSPEAKDWFTNWYNTESEKDHGILEEYWAGRRALLMKYSMLFTLNHSTELIIHKEDFLAADAYLTRVEEGMEKILRGLGKNLDSPLRYSIMDYLESVKECTRPMLIKRFHNEASASKVLEVVNELVQVGDVRRDSVGMETTFKFIKSKPKD